MNNWTEGRTRSFITSVLRAGMRRWPPKYKALATSKTERKVNIATGRLAWHHRCKKCNGEFTSNNVQVDHIKPVVDPKVGFVSWDEFIDRLYVDVKGMQILCKDCHKEKSKKETIKRVKTRKSND